MVRWKLDKKPPTGQCENVRFKDGAAYLNGVYCGSEHDGEVLMTKPLPRSVLRGFCVALSFCDMSEEGSGCILSGGPKYSWFGLFTSKVTRVRGWPGNPKSPNP